MTEPQNQKQFDVLGIGNPIVDLIAQGEEALLHQFGIDKGMMQLIELERISALQEQIQITQQTGGGSVANTLVASAQLGGASAYIGRVAADAMGRVFADDLHQEGVLFDTPRGGADEATGRCVVLVTPDGERSMSTYLGASQGLSPQDLSSTQLQQCQWLYLEGYGLDSPQGLETFAAAIDLCKKAHGRVALSLSDPLCVERNHDKFRQLLPQLDLLLCNRLELLALCRCDTLEQALAMRSAPIVACTDGDRGAHIVAAEQQLQVPAIETDVIDTTGAGDLFAAGFLWGISQGYPLQACAQMGCISASAVIAQIGARLAPDIDLKGRFARAGIL